MLTGAVRNDSFRPCHDDCEQESKTPDPFVSPKNEIHSGRGADFDYNWLKRSGTGTIAVCLAADLTYVAHYKATRVTYEVPRALTLKWAPIENLGLHFASASAAVNYVRFQITGPDFEMNSAQTPAVFTAAMTILVSWTFNGEAGEGRGLMGYATSVFGSDAAAARPFAAETGGYIPPAEMRGVSGGLEGESKRAFDNKETVATQSYHALTNKWFVIPPSGDTEGNSTVTVNATLLVSTDTGSAPDRASQFEFALPGRPRDKQSGPPSASH